jgi:hypothetical protein
MRMVSGMMKRFLSAPKIEPSSIGSWCCEKIKESTALRGREMRLLKWQWMKEVTCTCKPEASPSKLWTAQRRGSSLVHSRWLQPILKVQASNHKKVFGKSQRHSCFQESGRFWSQQKIKEPSAKCGCRKLTFQSAAQPPALSFCKGLEAWEAMTHVSTGPFLVALEL